jgi:Domain of unknown function (DUF5671)
MKTIRRLYFYAIALVSLEVVLWGLINLLRTALAGDIVPGVETLAQALALILVGVPIFLLHWTWIQRTAQRDEEEHAATLRAVFLYLTLLFLLIPAVQNTLVLINHLLLQASGLGAYQAIFGGTQSWKDNLIAIAFNLIAAAYFYNVLQKDWKSIPDQGNFADVRRLYRYVWLIYSVAMVVFGAQQILRYDFYIPSGMLGELGRETFVNGLALLIVGTPLWVYTWNLCQEALAESTEQGSLIRLGVLYLLALAGVITVTASAAVVLNNILLWILGKPITTVEFIRQVGGPLSILLPLAVVWAYYGHWLNVDIQAVPDTERRAGLQRFYYYILSLIGLVAAFTGLALLVSVVVDQLTGTVLWGETMRGRTSAAIATLAAGLPLWLLTWRPMQAEALASGPDGDHARRSLIRRIYLYVVIFAAVIGLMVSAITLVYQLLTALLGMRGFDFTSNVLNAIQLLLLFIGLLLYHMTALRRDNAHTADSLTSRYAGFGVMVFDAGDAEFVSSLTSAIHKHAPGMPVVVQPIGQPIPDDARRVQALVLPAALALDPPEVLHVILEDFKGAKVVVQGDTPGWVMSGQPRRGLAVTAQQAALALRQLSEGQEVRPSAATSAGMIVLYVIAVLFGIEVAFLLFGLLMSLIMNQ